MRSHSGFVRSFFALAAAIGLLVIAAPASAQELTTGRLTGRVLDEGGQPLPGSTIEAKNSGTGLTQIAVSDADGLFRIINLPVGTYDATASLSGFTGQTHKGLKITIGASLNVEFRLKLSAVAAEVTVTAEVPVVETTKTTTDTTVDSSAIQNLPIVGRNFTDFVLTTPNAQRETSRGNLSLAGQRGISTLVTVDGVDFSNAFFGGTTGAAEGRAPISISQESVREFQVVQAGASAEFGRSGGGFINVVTKSGSNDWHGSALAYLRPNSFVSDLADGSVPRESDKKNFGGSFGGPIMKDKLFFFLSYEQQRQNTTVPIGSGVRTSEAVLLTAGPNGRPAYPNYPQSGTDFIQTQDGDVAFGRLDFQINGANRVTARVNYTKYDGQNGTNSVTTRAEASNGFEHLKSYSGVANWNSMFGKSLINDLNFQYVNENIPREDKGLGLPEIQIQGGGPTLGEVSFLPITAEQDRITLYDSATFLTGNHVVKGGVEYNKTGMNQVFKGNWRGVFIFTNTTAGSGVPARTAAENFALGNWNEYREFIGLGGRSADVAGRYDQDQNEYAVFLQDQWFVNSQLTVTAGLRYEIQNNPNAPVLDRDKVLAATSVIQPDAQIPDAKNQWSPRLSLAWSPESKTVFRLSYGRYWSRFPAILTSQLYTSNGVVGTQYVVLNVGRTGPAAGTVAPGWGVNFNPTRIQQLGNLPAGTTIPTPPAFVVDPNFKNPVTDQFTLGAERDLMGISLGLEGQYSRGSNLERISDINLQQSSNPAVDCPNLPAASGVGCYGIKVGTANPVINRPNKAYGRITYYTSDAKSRFWSVTMKARKNFSNGLRFFASATRAEDKDSDSNERNFSGFFLEDLNNNELNYSFSDRDIKWRFLFNGNYDFKITSFLDAYAGVLFNYQTGRPWTALVNSDLNLDGNSGTDRPTINGVHLDRNSFRQPDFYSMDIRLGVGFGFGPGRLSVFGECFNCTNTGNRFIPTTGQNWGTGQTPANPATFNVATGVTSFPRTYQLGLRYDF